MLGTSSSRACSGPSESLNHTRERLTPLDERLARLLATIPIEVRHEGLSLATLQPSLRGRWRGNCPRASLGVHLPDRRPYRRRVRCLSANAARARRRLLPPHDPDRGGDCGIARRTPVSRRPRVFRRAKLTP